MILVNLLSFALSAAATGIILPLYVYPESNAAAWSPIHKAVATYPNVKWQIVINPASGPGTNSSLPYPNSDYITGIKALHKYPNVQTLGYVDTLWGRRSVEEVNRDVDKYAAWAKYSGGGIGMDGIFFDDVPSIYDFQDSPGTQHSNETYFDTITTYARLALPGDVNPLVLNSGNPGASSFFKYCDTMIEFENKYGMYKGQETLKKITSDGGTLSKTAIVTYSVPTDLKASDLNNVVRTMKRNQVELIGLTSDCCYNGLNGTLLNVLAAACDAAESNASDVTDTEAASLNNSTATLAAPPSSRAILLLGVTATILGFILSP